MVIMESNFIKKMGWDKKWTSKSENDNGKGIKVGSWNKGGALQPLQEKLNEIEYFMKDNNFSIFGISEANLFKETNNKDVQISGYTLFYDKGRENVTRKNSRCVVYIKNDLSFKLREDLMSEEIPEVWIEVGEPKKKRVLICQFYREFSNWNNRTGTDSIKSQKERFEVWLDKVGLQLEGNRELWLLGDFNLDLARKDDVTYNRKAIAQLAHEELICKGMVQLITEVTHRQQNKGSTIDLLFTNEPRKVSNSGVIATGSSHECI